jgi:DNA modification methylase
MQTKIGDATLYLGDCLDILPTLGPVDAVVTDPPYGIGFKYEATYKDAGGDRYVELLSVLKDKPLAVLQYPEEAMRYLVPLFGPPDECFIWVYNSNTNRQSRLWSFWNCDIDFRRVLVPAKNILDKRVNDKVAHYDWTAEFQQVKNVSEEKTDHPCQIPEGLMILIISFISAGIILDPFMGSGTTGVACARLGRKFIGIEIEPRYFEIACKRIKREYDQLALFPPEPKREAVQMELEDA